MRGYGVSTEPLMLVGYSDVDFAGDKADGSLKPEDKGGGEYACIWLTRKQEGFSLSTMEAELTAASFFVVVAEMNGIEEFLG